VLSNLRFTAGGQTTAFRGDRIDLASTLPPGTAGSSLSQLTYNWTLLAPPGPARGGAEVVELRGAFGSSPTWPDGNFTVSVTAIDAEGNASTRRHADHFRLHLLARSPILAAISDTAGPRPFDDHTFQAVPAAGRTTFSDDDTSGCPAPLVGQYSFTWSVVSSAPSVRVRVSTTRTVRP